MRDRIRQINSLGQSVWLDFISRGLLRSGRLAALVDAGVSGLTSNPTIFHKSIADGSDYDAQIAELAARDVPAGEIYERLALTDIAEAADRLRPVFNETHGRDGFVSIEVNPHLAHDTQGTIDEALRLHRALDRPNVMIKVPATEAGIPALTTLIGEGVKVNVTLLFSIAMYEKVMRAYLEGLRRLRAARRPVGFAASVASFFVSRVDTLVDRLLGERIADGQEQLEALLGTAAVANAKLAYERFRSLFRGPEFAEFSAAGARVQRPLWASTSTKNPAYPDLKYVEPFIGPDTVNTLPLQTLEAIRDHAVVAQTVEQDVDAARLVLERLAAAGIDMQAVTAQLLDEGVRAFADSYDRLLEQIDAKRDALAAAR